MVALPLLPPPEQGQIVTVRQRRYVVSDVQASALPATTPQAVPQHLVTLLSVEDDGLGESLQVIWEIEPGAQTTEQAHLPPPTRFDSPPRLDAFLDAVTWGAVAVGDTRQLQAPFRSGVEIAKYQLSPLVRALRMPRTNLLIADDVGLGKTVEAGLIVQELLVRGRIRTILIVCPAGLQLHWRDQMRDHFGLEFRLVDSEQMRLLRRQRGIHVNPWSHFPRLITSIDFLKRERPMRLLREVLPTEPTYPRRFDLLIVDEAHNVAPPGRGRYAVESLRTLAIRTLAPHVEHKLFLSATPHNGFAESFSALLELLDNQRFARGVPPSRQQLAAAMVRRLKSELTDDWGNPLFPPRQLEAIEVPYDEAEKQVHRWLATYSKLRQARATDAGERTAAEFVLKLLKKRLFSSPAAFLTTLERHRQTVEGRTDAPSSRKLASGILRRQIEQAEEESASDEEAETLIDTALTTASAALPPLSAEERMLLDKMHAWAEKAIYQGDGKTRALIPWLRAIVKPGGTWSDERVILFTEYRQTQKWLQETLAQEGLAGDERLQTLYGGMIPKEREAIKAAFQAHPQQSRVRILLATDAASEGIDLQNHCHRIVHLEIPWNPNRLEQRNGRIDRHGQRHAPLIFHFVAQGYQARQRSGEEQLAGELEADLEFLMRVAQKIERIREDLGKVGPVIADQVAEAMLGRRHVLDTDQAEREARGVREVLRIERNLREQIERHHRRLYETRHALRLEPENIRSVVQVALELAGQPPLVPAAEPGTFHLPALTGAWAACSEGLAHPHTHQIRPLTFDHEQAKRRDDVVLVHLNHRLVQMALRLLRAQIWSPESLLARVTARIVPDHLLPHQPGVVAHARLVVIGGDSHRLHEEIIVAGGEMPLDSRSAFQRWGVKELQRVLDGITQRPVSAQTQAALQARWPSVQPHLMQALEARQAKRLKTMTKQLQAQADKQAADIETILTELAATIRHELTTALQPRQLRFDLEGFTDSEREQLRRDVSALEARLTQIPDEIRAEQAAIRRRFADPQPRLFPVAVTLLIPQRLAGED